MLDFEFEEDRIEAFKDASTVTKEQLLRRINEQLMMAEIDSKDDLFKKHSASFRKLYIDLIRRFRDEVEEARLFEELEPYWSYTFEIDESGAVLHLEYADSVDFDDDGSITSVTVGQDFERLRVNTRLLTVEEYAEVYGVTESAVRQWVRRGKLRSAVKAGKEWRIPELSEVNNRGYRRGRYKCEPNLSDLPEKYSFIKGCKYITITQSKEDKGKYEVTILSDSVDAKFMEMDTKEREAFELFLISHPLIKADSELFGAYA